MDINSFVIFKVILLRYEIQCHSTLLSCRSAFVLGNSPIEGMIYIGTCASPQNVNFSLINLVYSACVSFLALTFKPPFLILLPWWPLESSLSRVVKTSREAIIHRERFLNFCFLVAHLQGKQLGNFYFAIFSKMKNVIYVPL